ncbi:MAG: tyrosine-type recombinase/integrase, partial [Saccharofermentans sp.]|nr:tyrosine-type recombinase/integrase [Saccharofermentans sp.]
VHTVLHQVFQFAVDDDLLRKNPCDRVLKELKNAYADRRTKRTSLTLQQEINFLTFIHENPRFRQWYPTFFVMANTGLRVGELTGLRWKDIDLTNGFVDVNHNLVYFNHMDGKGVYYSVYTPKTENGIRKVVMTQQE